MLRAVVTNRDFSAPFTIAIMAGWMVYGLIMSVSAFSVNWSPDPILPSEPFILPLTIGIFIFIGSLFVVLSEVPFKEITTNWAFDKMGTTLLMGGWIGYTIISAIVDSSLLTPTIFGASFVIALIARFVYTYWYKSLVKFLVAKWSG